MKEPHWIQKTHLFCADEYVCSKCGSKSPQPCKSCPRCGTGMAGSKYDPTWVDEMEGFSAFMNGKW